LDLEWEVSLEVGSGWHGWKLEVIVEYTFLNFHFINASDSFFSHWKKILSQMVD